MAIVVPDVGEEIALKAFLNHTASLNQRLKLFTNNVTPDDTFTVASLTEASGGGYADKALTGSSWTITGGTASYAQQTWTFTGPLTGSATVYGYYVVTDEATPRLMYCERASSFFQPTNNGDSIKLTPQITAD